MSEPRESSFHPLDGNWLRSKLHQHPQSDSGSETSGYSSTNVSGYSSLRSDSHHSLSCTRNSIASSHDEGSTINQIFIKIETYPPRLVQSASELATIGRHSDIISPRNGKLLNEFAPQLVDSMDAKALLPYLMRYGLADRDDQEFINNPHKTSRERNMHIIYTVPYKDSNAFERFVKCLEEVGSELGSQLRQRIRRSSSAQCLTQAEPRSQHGSCQEQPSNLYLDDADVVDERLLDSPSNESETSREHQTSDSERESPQSTMSELTGSTLIQTQPSTMSSALEHIVSKSTSPIQPYPEHDVGPRSQYAHPPIRHKSKLTRNERRQNETQAGFSHNDFSYDICKKLMQKRLLWLQESTVFKSLHEKIEFTSLTNCHEQRKLLHWGTLYQEGKVRFVVLLTDFLLVLSLLESCGHSSRAAEKHQFVDQMFSDNKYTTKRPLLLHHFEVQSHNKQHCSFSLYYKPNRLDMCFEAPSKQARDVWLEALTDTINNSCRMQRRLWLPIGNEGVEKFSGRGQWISLTILKASSLIWPEERIGYHRRLFCTVMLGRNQHCRTPSVEGKNTASWNFTFELWMFATTDKLDIIVWQENLYRPNDCLGEVCTPIWTMTDQCNSTTHSNEIENFLSIKLAGKGKLDLKISTDLI